MPVARFDDIWFHNADKEEIVKLVKSLYDAYDEIDSELYDAVKELNLLKYPEGTENEDTDQASH